MSRYPNPARRIKMLQAHLLRQQGLTLRQIADRMGCAHSTVAAYLADFERYRADLIQELAADQLVTHLIQLADPELEGEDHDRRLAELRELRLLLTSLPTIRKDEDERIRQLNRYGVSLDRYGNRTPQIGRDYPPTQRELKQRDQTPEPTELDPDQPLALIPEPSRTEPNKPEQAEPPTTEPALEPAVQIKADQPEQIRTEPNKPEQARSQIPVQNGETPPTAPIDPVSSAQPNYPGYIDDPDDPVIKSASAPRIREILERSRRKRPFRFPQAPNPQDRWSWIDHPQDPVLEAARESRTIRRIVEQSRQERQQHPAHTPKSAIPA